MPAFISPASLEKFTTFGDLLRFLRRRLGMTQMELADAVGYSDAQISRLEQNLRPPDLSAIESRFVPALALEQEPKTTARLLDLAANVRREDAPALGLCPYKGLNYFDEADADLFVGREALTKQLVERVLELANSGGERFLAIVGASGSGKSSLVRAGLVAALRWDKTSTDWEIHTLTPTAHPLENLATALAQDSNAPSATATLVNDLARDPHTLSHYARRRVGTKPGRYLLLVVDQFEELFALCRWEQERTRFIENLMTAASEADGCVVVVITLRADFYAHCAGYMSLRQALARQQQYIGAMNDEELRRAIEGSARSGHWEFEPGLVDLLMRDVGHEPGALPLLSHALLETWQRRRGRRMTLSGYASSRGVRGAIAETAEAVFSDQFTHEQQAIARRIFLRLTELGDETSTADTRRRATFKELISKPEEAATIHTVLKALADARLITTSEDSAEVAHEALIREWPTLRGWLEENREGLRLHRQLTEAAQLWETLAQDSSTLYRGTRLAQASEFAEANSDALSQTERVFLDASLEHEKQEERERAAAQARELLAKDQLLNAEKRQAAQERAANQRLRQRAFLLAGALALALLAALLAGFFAYRASADFTRADAQRLAAEANSLLQSKSDPQLIALLSLRSMQTQNNLEGDSALTSAALLALPQQTFNSHTNAILSARFAPDGKTVLTGGQDKTVRLWDTQTGQELDTFQEYQAPQHAIFSPDGNYVLSGGYDGSAELIERTTNQVKQRFDGNNGAIYGLVFSPDGKQIAIASGDGTTTLWDTATGQVLRVLEIDSKELRAVAFSPDGKYLVTTNVDAAVRLWLVENGTAVREFEGHTDEVTSVAFSPDGKWIVTGSRDKSVRLWDVASGQELRQFIGHGNWVNAVAVSPDGRLLLTGSADKTLKLWNIETGRELRQFTGQANSISAVAFSADGHSILSASYDGSVWIWNLETNGEHPPLVHPNSVYGVAFSPDGTQVVTGGADNLARLWDIATGRELVRLEGHSYWINSVAFAPDGKTIATGSLDGTARLWDVHTGQTLHTFSGQDRGVSSVAFSPDGRSLATGSWDGTAKLWDTQTGELQSTFALEGAGQDPQASIYSVAFSPDGKLILAGSYQRTVYLWDIETGKQIHRFEGHTDGVNGVAFSPDGNLAASGGYDQVARLWNVETGQQVQQLNGHTAFLYGVAFSPSGNLLLTASADNTARLWDVTNGQELRRFVGHTGPVEWAAFSPDGKRFATASDDNTVRIWDVDYHDTIHYLCSNLLRDFTAAEREQYKLSGSLSTCLH